MSDLSLDDLDGDSLPQSGDRLQILSHEEYEPLWGFPHFTQSDRDLFFTLTAPEREALEYRRSIRTKIHFLLHLGYFRACQHFFRFDLPAVRDDVNYGVVGPNRRKYALAIGGGVEPENLLGRQLLPQPCEVNRCEVGVELVASIEVDVLPGYG